MPTRDVVFPAGPRALYERNRYSPAARSGGFLFVSGGAYVGKGAAPYTAVRR